MEKVEKWEKKAVAYRRLFHKYPEPGWLTFFATIYIAEHLENAGYTVSVGREILKDEVLMDGPTEDEIMHWEKRAAKLATEQGISEDKVAAWMARMDHRTGVVAILDTKREGKTKAFRFDMDALTVAESMDTDRVPVQEQFVSQHPGISHACGHDGHMALGLTFAEYVAEQYDKLVQYAENVSRQYCKAMPCVDDVSKQKSVRNKQENISAEMCGRYMFIFQPAEEGVRGAFAFRHQWNFGKIDELYCCHIGFAPEDTFVAGAKGFLATSKFDVTFTGKSAHAGLAPERGRNALLAAAKATMDMQAFPRPDTGIMRLNVGKLEAGEARNTIPAHAKMIVETRGETGELNTYMKEQAFLCIQKAAKQYGVTYEVQFQGESVSAASDEALSQKVQTVARRIGCFSDYLLTKDFGASDDGAVFMDMVQQQGGQAVYMLLGTKIKGLHHESVFDFDETVLEKGFELYKNICEYV
ncbi:M20/M25/M40 family metallo-hydrolase [uncultured Eubacterium sp.]|uniref:M20/M25/M40 family metallo-hydrolase n=1 Tax=uncultured Eubacterium sp. TaxID=165185 RepID=UPI0025CC2A31|nr:M20/M25/M40 family metallo-hydrolase [uncultured Eubacterium sp.]